MKEAVLSDCGEIAGHVEAHLVTGAVGVQGPGQQWPDGEREEDGTAQGHEDSSVGHLQDAYLQFWDKILPPGQGRAHWPQVDMLHRETCDHVVG